ncbi:hypothetical protein PAQ31011_03043 [Pandoraea aquatica]|uniref:EF-hand domain-containing protein n=1 Tax=Pandoraea aquatica TaxID=2508290 RepID=A0A5E4W1S3_9BURK|nr:EF-hand domain-containing protein [Pandoraea aquatica]VVE18877.1 hypothetical protein PAQ31011_03043 [Pandoraea aquatica]
MTAANPLSTLLSTAFTKFDLNKDGKLDASEFSSFYEILKPGIAVDKGGNPTISEQDYFARMDHNGDGGVTRDEMLSTGVLMPADMTNNGSVEALLAFLQKQVTSSAARAAALLAADDPTPRA